MGRCFTLGSCSFFNSSNLQTFRPKSKILYQIVREAFPTKRDLYQQKFNIYRCCDCELNLSSVLETIKKERVRNYSVALRRICTFIRYECYVKGRRTGDCRCFPPDNDHTVASLRCDPDYSLDNVWLNVPHLR